MKRPSKGSKTQGKSPGHYINLTTASTSSVDKFFENKALKKVKRGQKEDLVLEAENGKRITVLKNCAGVNSKDVLSTLRKTMIVREALFPNDIKGYLGDLQYVGDDPSFVFFSSKKIFSNLHRVASEIDYTIVRRAKGEEESIVKEERLKTLLKLAEELIRKDKSFALIDSLISHGQKNFHTALQDLTQDFKSVWVTDPADEKKEIEIEMKYEKIKLAIIALIRVGAILPMNGQPFDVLRSNYKSQENTPSKFFRIQKNDPASEEMEKQAGMIFFTDITGKKFYLHPKIRLS